MKSLNTAMTVLGLSLLVFKSAEAMPVVARSTVDEPVKITDNGDTWTLDNGIVKALVGVRHSSA